MIKKIEKYYEYILLSAVLLFAFFIRVYNLGVSSLWVDEATSSVASLNIIAKGLPIFDSGLLYGRAYFFHYFQSFFLLFGQTEFLARFVSVLFGVGAVFLIYKIGKEYSKSGGIISALFMSIFYLSVFYSRQARFYQLFQLMFFLSIYCLYKSKENPKWLYFALVSFLILIDTQIAGLVLAPFFILHILYYSKKWKKCFAVVPGVFLIWKFFPAKNLLNHSSNPVVNYASRYVSYASNLIYMVVLFFSGLVWGFFKKKRLTALMILPTVALLVGVACLQTFAFRYVFFASFVLVLYFSLLMSFLYEKYGKIILVVIIFLILVPSNIFFPHTSVNILAPVDYSLYDVSAPVNCYKDIPFDVANDLKNRDNLLISFFSSDVEWNIRKPDYVLPFSMDGRGSDQISFNGSLGVVDKYSGALILDFVPERPYFIIADRFSVSKLKLLQRDNLNILVDNCSINYEGGGLKIYECLQ